VSEITRQNIFAQASRKLRQDFEELSTIPHNALKGAEAEKLVRTFLKQHLPRRFDVGSGFIIDFFDNVSKQTDVIVYDALNCPVYRASEDAAIFPSDNVALVVEVKSKLDKQGLVSAFENISKTKKLAKTQAPDNGLLTSQTVGCLFAFESSITLEKIVEHYTEQIKSSANTVNIGDHIDIIHVLDKGLVTLWSRPQGFSQWGVYIHEGINKQLTEGLHFALAIQELGESSLDGFLRRILTHLTFFRSIVDHPGFDWSSNPSFKGTKLTHLATICWESDPTIKQQKMEQYFREINEEFVRMNSSNNK